MENEVRQKLHVVPAAPRPSPAEPVAMVSENDPEKLIAFLLFRHRENTQAIARLLRSQQEVMKVLGLQFELIRQVVPSTLVEPAIALCKNNEADMEMALALFAVGANAPMKPVG